jgi:hypothetical protein
MVRPSLVIAVAATLAALAGCTMCCHPYDHCGPVYEGRYATGCSRNVHAGSIFSGTDGTSTERSSGRYHSEMSPQPAETDEGIDSDQAMTKKKQSSELAALHSGVAKKTKKTATKKTNYSSASQSNQSSQSNQWTSKRESDESLR